MGYRFSIFVPYISDEDWVPLSPDFPSNSRTCGHLGLKGESIFHRP